MPQVKVIQPIAEQAKKLRVAAYARVSSDSADQLNSFATQVDYYTSYQTPGKGLEPYRAPGLFLCLSFLPASKTDRN